jgi:hypothetical protein
MPGVCSCPGLGFLKLQHKFIQGIEGSVSQSSTLLSVGVHLPLLGINDCSDVGNCLQVKEVVSWRPLFHVGFCCLCNVSDARRCHVIVEMFKLVLVNDIWITDAHSDLELDTVAALL